MGGVNFDLPTIFFILTAGILGFTSYAAFFHPKFLRNAASRIFLYSAALVFSYLIILSFLQFIAFQGGILAPVLGSREGLVWFLQYVQAHFWNDYLISLPVAVALALVAAYVNKKYEERFFEREEPYLAALGVLLVGYPGFLFYLVAVLLLPVIVSAIFLPRGERLPLYRFWAPTAFALLFLIHFWAGREEWWRSFRF